MSKSQRRPGAVPSCTRCRWRDRDANASRTTNNFAAGVAVAIALDITPAFVAGIADELPAVGRLLLTPLTYLGLAEVALVGVALLVFAGLTMRWRLATGMLLAHLAMAFCAIAWLVLAGAPRLVWF